MTGYKFEESDIQEIIDLYSENGNVTETAKIFCLNKELEYTDSSRRRISNLLSRKGITKSLEEIKEADNKLDKDYMEAQRRVLTQSKFYIVTWEQNNTPLHKNLWNNILKYAEFLNAEVSVILGRYKNPTSVFSDEEYETWNDETRPYWDANRHEIHKYLTVLSDVKIQPTATNPLTGLESITGETSTIVGHPKMWLKPVPVLEGHPKKILLSTGAITVPNYTDSKAGKRGEMHHKLGFVIVEIKDEEVFFIRQVEADKNGNFIDLYYEVMNQQIFDLDYADALVWGDTHVNSLNPEILPATYGIIDKLALKYEVHHDLADGTSVNNHIVNNPVEQFKRMQEGEDDVNLELSKIITFLDESQNTQKIIVQSNHNDRFDRWVVNQDWKKDLKNALPYLKYTAAVLEGKANKGVLAYVIENEFEESEVLCLDYDDSFMISGFEVAHHGHIGANGSKGSLEQFRKMSTNMVVGHYHTPSRADKVLAVGTSSHLREGYNKGASSWLNSHVLIHKNGTAQHLIIVRGEFTTFE